MKRPEPRKKMAMDPEELERLVGTYGNGRSGIVLRARNGKLVGAQGGEFTKIGENRYLRAAVAGMPETEFIFSKGLDGTGAYLIRQGRALKKQ